MYRFALTFFIAISAVSAAAIAQKPDPAYQPDVNNGRYIYFAGGCASCHGGPASPKCDDAKVADSMKPVGGRCLKTPFGTFYVPNITPDKASGIGDWTPENFLKAMTRGVSPSGANYYPAFPYTSFQRMKRSDLLDLFAFLKTLEPVASNVPEHQLSFPYNFRWGLTFWKLLYLDKKTFKPDPATSDQINRGAYLVEGPGHCGECHTPRNFAGGKIESKKLAGAASPEGKGFIPNITPDKTGIGSWSDKDIVYALESGFLPNGDAFGGAMAEVQENLSKLTKEDREAIAAYLKSVPPIQNERPKKK